MGVRKALKKVARKARAPAKRIAKAAARQAVKELRGGARSLIARNPMVNMGLRSLIGNGDYKTNSLVRGGGGNTPNFGGRSTIVSRREYIGRVVSSPNAGEFQIQKYTINPGSTESFPWLAQIAANYESYRPLGLVYEFKSTSGESVGSTNTALGCVVMAAQYNSFAPDPTNRQQVEALPTAISIAPFENALCGIECKPQFRQASTLLIRNAYSNVSVGNAYDTLFDVGDFFVATDGCQGTEVALGELWVTYRIELLNPVLSPIFSWNQTWGGQKQRGSDVVYQSFWAYEIINTGDVEKTTPWDITNDGPGKIVINNVIRDQYYRFQLKFTPNAAGTWPGGVPTVEGFVLNALQVSPTGVAAIAGEYYFMDLVLTATNTGQATISIAWSANIDVGFMQASLCMIPNQLA